MKKILSISGIILLVLLLLIFITLQIKKYLQTKQSMPKVTTMSEIENEIKTGETVEKNRENLENTNTELIKQQTIESEPSLKNITTINTVDPSKFIKDDSGKIVSTPENFLLLLPTE